MFKINISFKRDLICFRNTIPITRPLTKVHSCTIFVYKCLRKHGWIGLVVEKLTEKTISAPQHPAGATHVEKILDDTSIMPRRSGRCAREREENPTSKRVLLPFQIQDPQCGEPQATVESSVTE
jgi:hypothetical protein